MASFIKGEQYPLPITVWQGNTEITPDNISAIRIKIGNFSASYPNGTLVYRQNAWQFPLTQEASYKMHGQKVPLQVQAKSAGGNILSSDESWIDVGNTIFGGEW